jgi:hypothetical protein
MNRNSAAFLLALVLAACATAPAPDPQAAYFAALQRLCGQTFSGKLEAGDPALDKDFAANPLRMGPVACADNAVQIPFAVGSDDSRTWIITRTTTGLRLKHRHCHAGAEETLSNYGGDTIAPGNALRQEFPADAFSIELFRAQDRAVSVSNVWAVEIAPGDYFAYELRRPGRFVRVRFALAGGEGGKP